MQGPNVRKEAWLSFKNKTDSWNPLIAYCLLLLVHWSEHSHVIALTHAGGIAFLILSGCMQDKNSSIVEDRG